MSINKSQKFVKQPLEGCYSIFGLQVKQLTGIVSQAKQSKLQTKAVITESERSGAGLCLTAWVLVHVFMVYPEHWSHHKLCNMHHDWYRKWKISLTINTPTAVFMTNFDFKPDNSDFSQFNFCFMNYKQIHAYSILLFYGCT